MARPATRLAAAGAVAYLGLVFLPYLLADPSEVGVYYGRVGLVGPLLSLAPAGVAFIAVASGAADRSDPQTMAGVAVVMGATTLLLTGTWAVPAGEVAAGMASVSASFDYHRWGLVAAAALLFAGCVAYAASALGTDEAKGV